MSDNPFYGLLDIIDLLAEQKVAAAGYDKTIVGSIVAIHEEDSLRTYDILVGNARYRAVSNNPETEYAIADQVYATLPNNDDTQLRIIIGKVGQDGVIKDAYSKNIDEEYNIYEGCLFSFDANGQISRSFLATSSSMALSPLGPFNNSALQQLAKSKKLLFEGIFTVNLAENTNLAQFYYGLQFTFTLDGTKQVIQNITLNEVEGDPYYLNEYLYRHIFDFEDYSFNSITLSEIQLVIDNSNNSTVSVTGIKLYPVSEFEESTGGQLSTFTGVTISAKTGTEFVTIGDTIPTSYYSLSLEAKMQNNGVIINDSSAVEYHWAIKVSDINSINITESPLFGAGWLVIDGMEGKTFNDIQPYTFATTNTYKCAAIYNGQTYLSNEITFTGIENSAPNLAATLNSTDEVINTILAVETTSSSIQFYKDDATINADTGNNKQLTVDRSQLQAFSTYYAIATFTFTNNSTRTISIPIKTNEVILKQFVMVDTISLSPSLSTGGHFTKINGNYDKEFIELNIETGLNTGELAALVAFKEGRFPNTEAGRAERDEFIKQYIKADFTAKKITVYKQAAPCQIKVHWIKDDTVNDIYTVELNKSADGVFNTSSNENIDFITDAENKALGAQEYIISFVSYQGEYECPNTITKIGEEVVSPTIQTVTINNIKCTVADLGTIFSGNQDYHAEHEYNTEVSGKTFDAGDHDFEYVIELSQDSYNWLIAVQNQKFTPYISYFSFEPDSLASSSNVEDVIIDFVRYFKDEENKHYIKINGRIKPYDLTDTSSLTQCFVKVKFKAKTIPSIKFLVENKASLGIGGQIPISFSQGSSKTITWNRQVQATSFNGITRYFKATDKDTSALSTPKFDEDGNVTDGWTTDTPTDFNEDKPKLWQCEYLETSLSEDFTTPTVIGYWGQSGSSPIEYTLDLTNDTDLVPANSLGTVPTNGLLGATTKITFLKNSIAQTLVQSEMQVNEPNIDGVGLENGVDYDFQPNELDEPTFYTFTLNQYPETWPDSLPFTFVYNYNDQTYEKVFTITKQRSDAMIDYELRISPTKVNTSSQSQNVKITAATRNGSDTRYDYYYGAIITDVNDKVVHIVTQDDKIYEVTIPRYSTDDQTYKLYAPINMVKIGDTISNTIPLETEDISVVKDGRGLEDTIYYYTVTDNENAPAQSPALVDNSTTGKEDKDFIIPSGWTRNTIEGAKGQTLWSKKFELYNAPDASGSYWIVGAVTLEDYIPVDGSSANGLDIKTSSNYFKQIYQGVYTPEVIEITRNEYGKYTDSDVYQTSWYWRYEGDSWSTDPITEDSTENIYRLGDDTVTVKSTLANPNKAIQVKCVLVNKTDASDKAEDIATIVTLDDVGYNFTADNLNLTFSADADGKIIGDQEETVTLQAWKGLTQKTIISIENLSGAIANQLTISTSIPETKNQVTITVIAKDQQTLGNQETGSIQGNLKIQEDEDKTALIPFTIRWNKNRQGDPGKDALSVTLSPQSLVWGTDETASKDVSIEVKLGNATISGYTIKENNATITVTDDKFAIAKPTAATTHTYTITVPNAAEPFTRTVHCSLVNDGDSIQEVSAYYVRNRNSDPPQSKPSNGYAPSGNWSLTLPELSSTNYEIYVSRTTKINGAYGDWSDPVLHSRWANDGNSVKDLNLKADTYVVVKKLNGTYSPPKVKFTAVSSNLTTDSLYNWTITGQPNSSNNKATQDITLTNSSFSTNNIMTASVSRDGYSDTISVMLIPEPRKGDTGDSPIFAMLSNSNLTFNSSITSEQVSSGQIDSPQEISTIIVQEGINRLTTDSNDSKYYSVSVDGQLGDWITISTKDDQALITISQFDVMYNSILNYTGDIEVIVSIYNKDTTDPFATFNLPFNISTIENGAQGSIGKTVTITQEIVTAYNSNTTHNYPELPGVPTSTSNATPSLTKNWSWTYPTGSNICVYKTTIVRTKTVTNEVGGISSTTTYNWGTVWSPVELIGYYSGRTLIKDASVINRILTAEALFMNKGGKQGLYYIDSETKEELTAAEASTNENATLNINAEYIKTGSIKVADQVPVLDEDGQQQKDEHGDPVTKEEIIFQAHIGDEGVSGAKVQIGGFEVDKSGLFAGGAEKPYAVLVNNDQFKHSQLMDPSVEVKTIFGAGLKKQTYMAIENERVVESNRVSKYSLNLPQNFNKDKSPFYVIDSPQIEQKNQQKKLGWENHDSSEILTINAGTTLQTKIEFTLSKNYRVSPYDVAIISLPYVTKIEIEGSIIKIGDIDLKLGDFSKTSFNYYDVCDDEYLLNKLGYTEAGAGEYTWREILGLEIQQNQYDFTLKAAKGLTIRPGASGSFLNAIIQIDSMIYQPYFNNKSIIIGDDGKAYLYLPTTISYIDAPKRLNIQGIKLEDRTSADDPFSTMILENGDVFIEGLQLTNLAGFSTDHINKKLIPKNFSEDTLQFISGQGVDKDFLIYAKNEKTNSYTGIQFDGTFASSTTDYLQEQIRFLTGGEAALTYISDTDIENWWGQIYGASTPS